MAANETAIMWTDIVKIVMGRQFLKYVGVFNINGEPLAQAGPLDVTPEQVKATAAEIRLPRNGLVQIDVSKLHFLCLGHGSGQLVGVSNFNTAYEAEGIREVDELLFQLTNRHFTRQDSLQAEHALQLAACTVSNTVLIGVAPRGINSCLEELQYMKSLYKTAQIKRSITKYSSLPRNPSSVSTDV